MGGHEARQYWEHTGLMMLMGALLLAPLAWLIDLQASYTLVKWACANDRRDVILLIPLGSLTLVGIGSWMAWSCWTTLRGRGNQHGGRMEDRSYFLALVGLLMNATFALLILTSLAPRYVLSPCE